MPFGPGRGNKVSKRRSVKLVMVKVTEEQEDPINNVDIDEEDDDHTIVDAGIQPAVFLEQEQIVTSTIKSLISAVNVVPKAPPTFNLKKKESKEDNSVKSETSSESENIEFSQDKLYSDAKRSAGHKEELERLRDPEVYLLNDLREELL